MKRVSKSDLRKAIQSRTARVAVTASAARGRNNAGVVAASRVYLREINLRDFGDAPRAKFHFVLDAHTRALVKRLPPNARRWGLARKFLNIFLRDSLYTAELQRAYRLNRHADLLEIPLDSITARELKKIAGRGGLPSWPGVRNLKAEVSRQYQAVATEEAKRRGIDRVHLDAIWWSLARD